MSRFLLSMALLGWVSTAFPQSADERRRRAEEWNEIVHEHVAASNSRLERKRAAKTDEERQVAAREYLEKEYELCRRALAVAEAAGASSEGDPHAWFALNHILMNPHDEATGARAAELAIRRHADRLPELCSVLAWGLAPSAAGEAVFRAVLENPEPEIRGPACVHFAEYLRRRSEAAKQVGLISAYADDLAEGYGRDYADHVAAADGERDADEARRLLERAIAEFGDVLEDEEFGDRRLDEVARERLHVVRDLSIGKAAPTIVGTDVSGATFTSEDHAGKVRVLYFWGHWCVGCRSMYPKAAAMGETFRDEPFAFLGVNSDDDPELVERLVNDGTLTFPVWFDGGRRGPIAQEWAIYGAPHVYVLDVAGTIRWKSRERLEQVVRKLLDEARPGDRCPN